MVDAAVSDSTMRLGGYISLGMWLLDHISFLVDTIQMDCAALQGSQRPTKDHKEKCSLISDCYLRLGARPLKGPE